MLGVGLVAYVRTVRTASGATAVQIVHGFRVRDIEHVGSAHDELELEELKAVAGRRAGRARSRSGRRAATC